MNNDGSFKVVLVGRHISPAEHIVFLDGIPDDKIADYDWLQSRCVQWLKHTLSKMGGYNTHFDMALYVEGYTPATIAFLQAWRTMYRPDGSSTPPLLLLMHYQPATQTYNTQEWRA